jgi:hypothetical protein
MICGACGKELPIDARYCLRCGKPQTAEAAESARGEAQWETARIRSKVLGKERFSRICRCAFVLEAIGLGGAYIADQSRTFEYYFGYDPLAHGSGFVPVNENRTTRAAFESFVTRIVATGWEPVPWQESWYHCHFRRSVAVPARKAP